MTMEGKTYVVKGLGAGSMALWLNQIKSEIQYMG